ncbi:MAG: phosphoribosylpyrophosphate synthetase [bacterium]
MSKDTYMTPLVQILPQLRDRGYTCDFELTEDGLFCKETNEVFQPEDLIIERVYRFEGDSNPDDMAVLYGVKAFNGVMGVIIDAYGTYDNDELGDFLRYVKVIEIKD